MNDQTPSSASTHVSHSIPGTELRAKTEPDASASATRVMTTEPGEANKITGSPTHKSPTLTSFCGNKKVDVAVDMKKQSPPPLEDKPGTEDAQKATETAGIVPSAPSVMEDVPMTFPQRLMEVLSNEENSDIIGWLPHGNGFMIYQKKRFATEVMPRYFKHSKFTSFTRKLNRWSFTRVTRGQEIGAYYHPFFKRGEARLCMQMSCKSSTPQQPPSVPSNPLELMMPMGAGAAAALDLAGASLPLAGASALLPGQGAAASLRKLQQIEQTTSQMLLRQRQEQLASLARGNQQQSLMAQLGLDPSQGTALQGASNQSGNPSYLTMLIAQQKLYADMMNAMGTGVTPVQAALLQAQQQQFDQEATQRFLQSAAGQVATQQQQLNDSNPSDPQQSKKETRGGK